MQKSRTNYCGYCPVLYGKSRLQRRIASSWLSFAGFSLAIRSTWKILIDFQRLIKVRKNLPMDFLHQFDLSGLSHFLFLQYHWGHGQHLCSSPSPTFIQVILLYPLNPLNPSLYSPFLARSSTTSSILIITSALLSGYGFASNTEVKITPNEYNKNHLTRKNFIRTFYQPWNPD